LDEFVINYENYAHQRWTNLQLNGIPGDAQAEPPVLPVIGNAIARQADMLQIVTDGICKEFKIHYDNIQLDLTTTTFHNLEIAVQQWQRSTTTGKAFTSACNPAFDNVNVSAMDIVNPLEEDKDKLALMDSQTNSPHVSSASTRGQRGGRGGRGAGRGGRGRGGRGRVAGSNTSNQAIKIIDRHKMEPFISPYMATLYVIIAEYQVTRGKNALSRQLIEEQVLQGYSTQTGTKQYPITKRPKLLQQQ
jgi:hypothetical protein